MEGISGFRSEEECIRDRSSSKNPKLLLILLTMSLQVKKQDLGKRAM